jgi:HD-GYP domain-containing protein (c-di-GMP phosphodiesterase class II)
VLVATSRSSAPTQPASGRKPKVEAPAWPAPLPSHAQLASAFSQALDLGEGAQPGHAARVCYIALNLADGIELEAEERSILFYAALLHDAGAGPASAELCRILNLSEEVLFSAEPGRSPQQLAMEAAPTNATAVVEVLHGHPARGSLVAKELGFNAKVQAAIGAHHERWDGHGYPRALKGARIPMAARLVAAGDLIESLIAAEANPLNARRTIVAALAEFSGSALDPELARVARDLVRSDRFWLGLHNELLPQELPERIDEDAERAPADLNAFAKVFAALADAKGEHTQAHSTRVAEIADTLAGALHFEPERREQLRISALLHDIGLMGVPARTIAKPDILSLSEMEMMRKHPAYSQMVLEGLPGLEGVAHWVGAHHERPDGRGYPEMLDDESLPIEARIIAVADTYVALTSPRPYRKALAHEDAKQVLLGGAGTQLDQKLVQLLCALDEPTSSRSAPRSARTR